MKKTKNIFILGLIFIILIAGCNNSQEKAKTPEQIAEEKYVAFEKEAVEVAKEFVLATQGDKEKIKELAFQTLLKEIKEKNWSIMLVEEMKIKPNTLETTTEKLGEKQVLVRVFYQGEMTVQDKIIDVKLSNKVGVIEQDGRPVVFSYE